MRVERRLTKRPLLSVCIPQYNRTSFLIAACKSLARQTYSDFEVCISDDCSTDGREAELLDYLEQSGLSYIYHQQEVNRRYDANLRAALSLAQGQYALLLGNDDALASPDTLEEIATYLEMFGEVGVALTNYEEYATGSQYRRVSQTGIVGRGPDVAVRHFRDFSFVSGVILRTAKAHRHVTSKWDGSEMYQMYLGCRILAEGGALATIDRVTVRKGIQIPGEEVDSIERRARIRSSPIIERQLPMVQIGRLVIDAIRPYVADDDRHSLMEKVLFQFLVFTYTFWPFEYRRIQSWRYALGVCLGMRPRNIFRGLDLRPLQRMRLTLLYGLVSVLGLTMPIRFFYRLYPRLYYIAKNYSLK